MAEKQLKMPASGQITTFAEIPKPIRARFTHYISQEYDMPISTAYSKIRLTRIEKWEWDGIENCICEFLGGTPPKDFDSFFDDIPNKWEFMRFMAKRSMCPRTAFLRFTNMKFKAWELKGIRAIWEEFLSLN